MLPQDAIGILFGVCALVLAVGFVTSALLARKGPDDYGPIHRKGYAVRRYWFIALMAVGLVALGLTLPHMPYPLTRKPAFGTPVTVVKVTAQDWQWTIEPKTIRVGDHVEFRVTSLDVNHGFTVYRPDGRIVGQVQAMPTVTNDLYLTFDEPGTYLVRCLELCGLYHTAMIGQIKVVA